MTKHSSLWARYLPENSVVMFGMILITASFILSVATTQPPRPEFITAGSTFVMGGSGMVAFQEYRRRKANGKETNT